MTLLSVGCMLCHLLLKLPWWEKWYQMARLKTNSKVLPIDTPAPVKPTVKLKSNLMPPAYPFLSGIANDFSSFQIPVSTGARL